MPAKRIVIYKEDKLITIILIIIIIILLLLWGIVSYNNFIKLRNNVKEAFSTMDIYLKKRFDLIPNLVETVKGYTKHESTTLEKVINARNKVTNAQSIPEQMEAESSLTNHLDSLFALSESYPDLKANRNFISLQNQLNQIENDIAYARKYYNGAVKQLNMECESFPSALIAKLFKFEEMPMYQITNNNERENIEVKF